MPHSVFLDSVLNNQLFEQGFVKIPFWTDEVTRLIRSEYITRFETAHTSNKKFHTTYETVNPDLIQAVNAFLQPYFLERAASLFAHMQPISAAFLAKEPGPNSESPLHQDAQFVDEPAHYSVSVWVALQDCNRVNSTVQFVPGSHRVFNGIRYIPYANNHIEPYLETLRPLLVSQTIKAGEAFIFLNATVHGSTPNTSKNTRLAAVMGFYPKGTALSLYKKNDERGSIERYGITPDDLLQINKAFTPLPQSLISTHPVPRPVNREQVLTLLNAPTTKTGPLKMIATCLKSVFQRP